MKPDEDCPLCTETLDEACKLFPGPLCELKEKYETTDMSAGDALSEFMGIVTPEQKQEIVDGLVAQGKAEKISPETP